jgi:hypothetical protein
MPFSHRPEVFESDEVARMTEAYTVACADLARAKVAFSPEDLANSIIVLAKNRELDSVQLAQSAIERMRDSGRSA